MQTTEVGAGNSTVTAIVGARQISGPSLILKKGCLHKAGLGYTPLVEVNQAISAWSYKTTYACLSRGRSPPVQIVHFSQAYLLTEAGTSYSSVKRLLGGS